jgi:hypothetical protein
VQRPLFGLGSLFACLVACGGQEPPAKPPPPPPAPKDPPALVGIAQACARVSACARSADSSRFRDPSACVDWFVSEPKDAFRACLLDAKGCDQVSTCMHGGGDARAAAFCKERPGVVSACDGDRLVSCGEDDAHESSVVDCAAMGASCRESRLAGGLVVRACASPQKCPAGVPDTRCDGPGAVISCRDGAFERVTCRPGTACEERRDESGDTLASCELPNRRRCTARGVRRCEEGRLVECTEAGMSGKAKIVDCVGAGLECAGTGPRAGCYVPTKIECDRELLPKCDGGSLVFCAAGRLARVGCSAIGLGACDPSARGSIAACSARTGSK